jgi:hypothetical protein
MESINVVIDDEEVERPSSGEENQLDSVEDTTANPPKRSWVKLNHPPQQLLGTVDEGRRLRNRVIQPTSEVANEVSCSCYLAQTEPMKDDNEKRKLTFKK